VAGDVDAAKGAAIVEVRRRWQRLGELFADFGVEV
jgi:hypothetical protein